MIDARPKGTKAVDLVKKGYTLYTAQFDGQFSYYYRDRKFLGLNRHVNHEWELEMSLSHRGDNRKLSIKDRYAGN